MATISEQIAKDQVTLLLSGRFEFPFHKAFNLAIEKAKDHKPKTVILDFSDVSFIDSSGLGMLMLANKILQEANITLRLHVPPGYVMEVFTLASTDKKIPISPIPAKQAPTTSPKPSIRATAPPPPPLVFEADEMQELLLPILHAIEQNTIDLPPLPKVASQVLALTADPNATANRLTTIIQQDPILTAKIFKTANSAGGGTNRSIESLPQAIAWLGLNSVASLTVALSLQSGVFNDRGYEREVRDLWAHAVATAFYAKALAGMIGKSPDTAFLCGILHNIGKLVVVHQVNQSQGTSSSPLRWSVISTLMRQSYIEIGRRLADAWKFPVPIKEAITLHQDYSYHLATDPSKAAALTCLAGHLATHHIDSVPMSEVTLLALPVAAALKVPKDVMGRISDMKTVIQGQIDSLLR